MSQVMCIFVTAILALVVSAWGGVPPLAAQDISTHLRAILQQRLPAAGTPATLTVGDARLQSAEMLTRFYAQRAYQPAWVDQDGALPGVETLRTVLAAADREGLRPKDYHLTQLEARWQDAWHSPASHTPLALHRLIDLELLCTDAFLLYASHARSGRLNPAMVEKAWHLERRDVDLDLTTLLQHALTTNTIAESLHRLLPHHPVYTGLRQALSQYRRLAAQGGWPLVQPGRKKFSFYPGPIRGRIVQPFESSRTVNPGADYAWSQATSSAALGGRTPRTPQGDTRPYNAATLQFPCPYYPPAGRWP